MEKEFHPFLDRGEAIAGNKMFVGTFPTYSLTKPLTPHKEQIKVAQGDVDIFYGSHRNLFRNWYKTYVDPEINIIDPESIWNSLTINGIAISDVIKSALRNEGANDKGLIINEWNLGLANIIEDRINKIICTSKSQNGAMGWLINNVLLPHGFVHDPIASNCLQNLILNQIEGTHQNFSNPIANIFSLEDKTVQIIGIPSPGSPYRQLHQFGYDSNVHKNDEYLHEYLKTVYYWFMNL